MGKKLEAEKLEVKNDKRLCRAGAFPILASSFLLLASVCLAFWGVWNHQFVAWDDNYNVYDNPRVQQGLTPGNAAWAVTSMEGGNWFPATWISWMAFGTNPRAQHLANLALHAANAVLVFLILLRIVPQSSKGANSALPLPPDVTPSGSEGSALRLFSAFLAAAIFALHPLRAESVAWVSGRTDLLAAFFALAAILCYLRDLRPLALFLFALAVMSKSSAVAPLPFAMAFLVWVFPFQHRRLEYLSSFAAMAAGGALLQGMARSLHGSVIALPLLQRAGNMAASYASFVGKAIWPANLSPAYPLRLVSWQMGFAAFLLLGGITLLLALQVRRGRSELLIGWIWFLMMLGPFVGAFQAIEETVADRYTYLPLLGLIVPAAWLLSQSDLGLAFGGVAALSLFVAVGAQAQYWRDSRTLFSRAVAATSDNYKMHNQLGYLASKAGRHEEAVREFQESIRIAPGYTLATSNLLYELKHGE